MEPPRRCAVTGANGYVGSLICRALLQAGMQVVKFHRRARECEEECPYFLEKPPAVADLRGFDALVHCAWDFKATRWEQIQAINVEGSLRLFERAHAAGVQRLVFVSTMSAFPGCRSLYGKAKLEIERRAADWGVDLVRPGLVYGSHSGGMMGALSQLTKFPLLPVVGSKRQLLYLVHEDDLGKLIAGQCRGEIPRQDKPILAASPGGYPLKKILQMLASAQGRKNVFLPIPWRGAWLGLKLMELLGLRCRLRSDGLLGLMNADTNPDFEVAKTVCTVFRDRDFVTART